VAAGLAGVARLARRRQLVPALPRLAGAGAAYPELIGPCTDYAEATGDVGDVYLIHPLVLHTMSPNVLRRARFITNSTHRLGEPQRDRKSVV